MKPGEFRCLAIDTSTDVPSVAACRGEKLAERRFGAGHKTEEIFSHLQAVLDETGLLLRELDCIAVGSGPGSFTGLRVGAAAAQSLAFGADLPVCPRSSLAILAFGAARRSGFSRVAPMLDARMGEVYAGLYQFDGQALAGLMPDCLAAPDALELPGDESFVAAGPGWAAYPVLAQRFGDRQQALLADARPGAADLLVLAEADYRAGRTVPAAEALPQYLRNRVTA